MHFSTFYKHHRVWSSQDHAYLFDVVWGLHHYWKSFLRSSDINHNEVEHHVFSDGNHENILIQRFCHMNYTYVCSRPVCTVWWVVSWYGNWNLLLHTMHKYFMYSCDLSCLNKPLGEWKSPEQKAHLNGSVGCFDWKCTTNDYCIIKGFVANITVISTLMLGPAVFGRVVFFKDHISSIIIMSVLIMNNILCVWVTVNHNSIRGKTELCQHRRLNIHWVVIVVVVWINHNSIRGKMELCQHRRLSCSCWCHVHWILWQEQHCCCWCQTARHSPHPRDLYLPNPACSTEISWSNESESGSGSDNCSISSVDISLNAKSPTYASRSKQSWNIKLGRVVQ